jgi:DNA helicase-2/ATP-dependent DNA helicase PcrA
MHCAKGLEFDYVYIAGIEDGILPHNLSLSEVKEIEEERRLLYVGITRARKEVRLNHANSRRVGGSHHYQLPSRFLNDIDVNMVTNSRFANPSSFTSNVNITKQNVVNHVIENEKHYKIGQTVSHTSFGKGKILNVDGKGVDAKLTVSFGTGDLKKLDGRWVGIVDS